mgnify:CR=1 FL=1
MFQSSGESFRFDVDLLRGDPARYSDGKDLGVGSSAEDLMSPMASPMAAVRNGADGNLQAQVESLERERDVFRKRFLAEQRLHFEADQELSTSRERVRQLKQQVEQLTQLLEEAQSHEKSPGSDASGMVHKKLEAADARVQTLEAQLRLAHTQVAKLQAGGESGGVDLSQYVRKEHFLDVQRRAQELEAGVVRQAAAGTSLVQESQTTVQRLCAMALPAAVSALYKMSEDSGHGSSATWALIRAEDHIAQIASAHFPISINSLVQSAGAPESSSAAHEATLVMAIISWDTQGRKLLMQEPGAVAVLLNMLQGARSTGAPSEDMQLPLIAGSPQDGERASEAELCARFAAMTLGNFSLEESGRALIAAEQSVVASLIDTVRGTDAEAASFALLVVGNLCMITEARSQLLEIRGGVESIFRALHSRETQTVRFAVGAVRNFAADEMCRAALLRIGGAREVLEQLTQHPYPRIRDHAAHALANLDGGMTAAAASFAQQAALEGDRSNQLLADFAAYPVAGEG